MGQPSCTIFFMVDWPNEATAGAFAFLNYVDVEGAMSLHCERGDSIAHHEAFAGRTPLRDSVEGINVKVAESDAAGPDVTVHGIADRTTRRSHVGLTEAPE